MNVKRKSGLEKKAFTIMLMIALLSMMFLPLISFAGAIPENELITVGETITQRSSNFIVTWEMVSEMPYEMLVTVQNLASYKRDVDLTAILSNTISSIDSAKITGFYEWKNVSRVVEQQTVYSLDWKQCKENALVKSSGELRSNMELINIPQLGSKESDGTVNGTKRFKLNFQVPMVQTNNGYGASGRVAVQVDNDVFDPWYDSNWGYRKSHVVNNATGAGVNYTVPIIVINATGSDSGNTTYINNKTRTDFGDFRPTNETGSLFYYWMETYVASVNATFWVNVADSLETVAQTIYIYYGKADATTTSNGANTFPFFDHFDGDLSKWSGDTAEAAIASSICTYTNPAVGEGRIYSAAQSGDIAFRSRATIANSDFSAVGLSLSDISHFILVNHDTGQPNHSNFQSSNGTLVSISNTLLGFAAYHTYEIQRILTGTDTIRGFMDGVQLGADSTSNVPTDNFPAIIRHYDAGATLADWVLVRKCVKPEPTHGAWGSEETVDLSAPTFGSITANSTVASAGVQLNCTVSDNIAVSGYIFEWNNTGTKVNGTWTAGGSATLSGTWNSTVGAHITATVYANDTSNNWNSTSATFTLTAETTAPTYSALSSSTTVAGASCQLNSTWTDETGLATTGGFIIGHNNTGTFTNATWTAFTSNPNTTSTAITLNSTVGNKVQWQVWANDTSNNWNNTGLQTITLTDGSAPTFGAIVGSTTVAGAVVTYTCTISDNVAVSGYIPSWDNSGVWVNGTWTAGGSGSLAGTHNIVVGTVVSVKFWANDTSNNWAVSATSTFTLTDGDAPTFSGHSSNSVEAYTTCNLNVSVADNNALSFYILSTNNTGTWTNNTAVAFSTNPQTLSVSITLNFTVGSIIQWRWFANDTANNWATSVTQTLTVTSTPLVSIVQPFNRTYVTGTVPVELSVSGVADTAWFNVKNGSVWVYGANTTYTTATSLTGFVNGSYTFYAFASNSEGGYAEDTVVFTVGILPDAPLPHVDVDSFWLFLYEGDFFGFLQAYFISVFLNLEAVIALIVMLFLVPLYLRTKSLLLICILWLLIGSFFILYMPMASGIAVIFIVLAIGGLLWRTFKGGG